MQNYHTFDRRASDEERQREEEERQTKEEEEERQRQRERRKGRCFGHHLDILAIMTTIGLVCFFFVAISLICIISFDPIVGHNHTAPFSSSPPSPSPTPSSLFPSS